MTTGALREVNIFKHLRKACLCGTLVLLCACTPPQEPAAQTETDRSAAPPANPYTDAPLPPVFSADDWRLRLVNRWTPLPDEFTVDAVEVDGGYRFDSRAADALHAMLTDCRAAGLHPQICSAYRTRDYQTALFEKQCIKQQREYGLEGEAAVQAAGTVVAVPGTSEHELGLAVDICSASYPFLDEAQERTPEYQWLLANCAGYGFILRYPPGTTDQTGIIYEPWHFRYVGKEAAAYIMERGWTLETFHERIISKTP